MVEPFKSCGSRTGLHPGLGGKVKRRAGPYTWVKSPVRARRYCAFLLSAGSAERIRPLDDIRYSATAAPNLYRHPRAVMRDLGSDVGVGSMIAALAPDDEPHMRGERLPQG